MEKSKSVDQKRQQVFALLAARPELFGHQGQVLVSWRRYAGRTLGPYFRLMYREHGKQQTVYLGACPAFADEVRRALARLQSGLQHQRRVARQRAAARAALRDSKQAWQAELQKQGLFLKGYEVRGFRRSVSRPD